MLTHKLQAKAVEDDSVFLGRFLDESHYETLLDETGRILKPDGSLLLALIRRGIPPEAGRAMFGAIRNRIATTNNRGTAAGGQRRRPLLKNGLRSRTSYAPEVRSSIFGYYDRYPRIPYCRKAAFNLDHPAAAQACIPALQAASELFRRHAPERFAVQRAIADKTHPDFLIPGTVFTTVTLNKNFRTAAHRDAGDLPDGFGVMTYYRAGKFTGGHLVFPAYRVAVALETYDCLLFDPHETHGNTAFVPLNKAPYERITCVHYYRKGMFYCGSAAQELELAKRGNRSPSARPPA